MLACHMIMLGRIKVSIPDTFACTGRLVAPASASDEGVSAGDEVHEHVGAHPAAGMFLVATVHFSGTMKLQVCYSKTGLQATAW